MEIVKAKADTPDIESLVKNSGEVKNDEPIKKDVESDIVNLELKPLAEFDKDKVALNAYGKTLGVDLKRNMTIENMYASLVEFTTK